MLEQEIEVQVRKFYASLHKRYGVRQPEKYILGAALKISETAQSFKERNPEPVETLVQIKPVLVKIRFRREVASRALYFAMNLRPDGSQDLAGLWLGQLRSHREIQQKMESASFWAMVMLDLEAQTDQPLSFLTASDIEVTHEFVPARP